MYTTVEPIFCIDRISYLYEPNRHINSPPPQHTLRWLKLNLKKRRKKKIFELYRSMTVMFYLLKKIYLVNMTYRLFNYYYYTYKTVLFKF